MCLYSSRCSELINAESYKKSKRATQKSLLLLLAILVELHELKPDITALYPIDTILHRINA